MLRIATVSGKVFKKINFSPSPALLKEVAAAHPGAIERLLFLLKNQVKWCFEIAIGVCISTQPVELGKFPSFKFGAPFASLAYLGVVSA